MPLLESSIIDIIKKYDTLFLSMNNVIGIGLGNKIINGIDTKEPCIHILVTDKLKSNNLYKKDIIPNRFLGIKTDVVKSGGVALQVLDVLNDSEENLNDIKILKSYKRPLQSGFSIGVSGKSYAGTIGAIVFDNEDNTPYILSNNHVLSNMNQLQIAHPIIKPGKVSNKGNIIGYLYKKVMINFSNSDKELVNYADCAIAKVNPQVSYTTDVYKLGKLRTPVIARIGMGVRKVGQSTGLTESRVTATGMSVKTKTVERKPFILKEQIECEYMSRKGDSGSVVVDVFNQVIGIVSGGTQNEDNDITIINPIDRILKYFNIHFNV